MPVGLTGADVVDVIVDVKTLVARVVTGDVVETPLVFVPVLIDTHVLLVVPVVVMTVVPVLMD